MRSASNSCQKQYGMNEQPYDAMHIFGLFNIFYACVAALHMRAPHNFQMKRLRIGISEFRMKCN